jgi:hypothetical protein
VKSADARIRTLNLSANAGTELAKGLELTGRVRYFDYDNQTDRVELPGYVRFDAVWESEARITVPYGWSRRDLGAELAYAIARASHASIAYNRQTWDRTFREIDGSHEDSVKFAADTRRIDRLTLRGSYEHGSRKTDTYDTNAAEASFVEAGISNNQPGLRKFDEADRTFNAGNALAMYALNDKTDFSLGFHARKDDYKKSALGLRYWKLWSLDFEAGYSPRADMNVSFFASHALRRTLQNARQSGAEVSTNPLDDWLAKLSESNDVIGVNFDATFAKRWTAAVGVQWNRADGNSVFFSPPGGTPDVAFGFPEYDDNRFTGASARLDYKLANHASVSGAYWHEDYNADRFSRDGLSDYMPATLLLNANDGDYVANVVAGFLKLHW